MVAELVVMRRAVVVAVRRQLLMVVTPRRSVATSFAPLRGLFDPAPRDLRLSPRRAGRWTAPDRRRVGRPGRPTAAHHGASGRQAPTSADGPRPASGAGAAPGLALPETPRRRA
ncbi:hypothetical protein GCM10009866_29230 [Cellulomonas aerilata]